MTPERERERETGQTDRNKKEKKSTWCGAWHFLLQISSPPPHVTINFFDSWCVPNDTTEVEVQVRNTNTFFFFFFFIFQFIMLGHLASRISHAAGVIYTHSHPQLRLSDRLRPSDTLKQQEVTKPSLYLYDSSSSCVSSH